MSSRNKLKPDVLFSDMFDYAVEYVEPVAKARVVAVLMDGSFSVWGQNSKKSHPFQKRFAKNEDCIFLHAEIDAIKQWIDAYHPFDPEALKKANLYIMRVKRDGRFGPMVTGLAKPCMGCMRAIVKFEIRNVFYTEDKASQFTCL